MTRPTAEDPTVELSLTGHEDVYTPAPYLPPRTVGEHVSAVWHVITCTPRRSALSTLLALAALIGGLALTPVTVATADARGPLIAHCGVGYYLFGHPNPVVRSTCLSAYAGHATVLFASAAVVSISTIGVLLGWRRRRPREPEFLRSVKRLVDTPTRSSLTTVIAVSGLVGLASLRTAPIHLRDRAGPLTAHCGLNYYLFGNPDSVVAAGCHRAFGGHATVLLISLIVGAVASALLVGLASSFGRPKRSVDQKLGRTSISPETYDITYASEGGVK